MNFYNFYFVHKRDSRSTKIENLRGRKICTVPTANHVKVPKLATLFVLQFDQILATLIPKRNAYQITLAISYFWQINVHISLIGSWLIFSICSNAVPPQGSSDQGLDEILWNKKPLSDLSVLLLLLLINHSNSNATTDTNPDDHCYRQALYHCYSHKGKLQDHSVENTELFCEQYFTWNQIWLKSIIVKNHSCLCLQFTKIDFT